MLIKILKRSFKILWQNSIIIQPFILFLFLMSIVLSSIKTNSGLTPVLISFGISAFALLGAFMAGWLQLFQAAIRNSEKEVSPTERAELSLDSFREFLPAVGRFFVPITIAMILYVVLFLGLLKLILFVGMKYIGLTENLTPARLSAIFGDKQKVYEFVTSLTLADKEKLIRWDCLTLLLTGIFSYLTMFWPQSIMMNGENAVKALWSSIKANFAHPFVTLGIFLLYWATNFATSLVTSIFAGLFIVQLLNLMLVIFITVYFIMVNFVYFEEYSANHISGWSNIFR